MANTINVTTAPEAHNYDIFIGDDLLPRVGRHVKKLTGITCQRVVIVSNKKVFGLYGSTVVDSLEAAGFITSTILIGDGEKYKSLTTAEKILSHMSESGVRRSDIVLALGGGVVGDAAGFAASVYMRGVGVVQVPTTLLSMIDSSTGGKTGVNSTFGKNLIGSFHHPLAVIADVSTLKTLPAEELRAGLCEAIKQGALSGKQLFDATARSVENVAQGDIGGIADLIALQIKFKASIVAGDERESMSGRGSRSRKVLNFGHTFAHALETVTDYKRLRHGEAVGYGILMAAELSKSLDLLDHKSVNLLYDVVRRVGSLPYVADVEPDSVMEMFKHDKKVLSGGLEYVLLRSFGRPVIQSADTISPKLIHSAISRVIRSGIGD
jgi:3-dehydroquinate synthase